MEEAAARFPQRKAYEDETCSMTFSEVRRLAASIGTGIAALENPGRPVAVFMEKSVWMAVSLLGVSCGGCIYCPVDVAMPEARMDRILSVLEPAAVLTSGSMGARAREACGDCPVLLVEDLAARPNSLWRYRELLPVRDAAHIVSMNEGMTPLIPLEKLGRELGLADLRLKDESPQPTGTFKARGASVGVSRAKELGVRTLAMPTNGNAGGAWAAYCARAGIRAVLVMPRNAPAMNRMEIGMLGASLFLVGGVITDAGIDEEGMNLLKKYNVEVIIA